MEKTCEWCNRTFKHQGALNLHKSVHCKSKPSGSVPVVKKEEQVKKQVSCEHEFRFLRDAGVEGMAKQNGYSEVCVKCQTLQA
jgi:hypothetical protein